MPFDPSVYGNVTINGEDVPDDRIEIRGDLKSYSSESGSALVRPSISFDNHVNKNVIKDLLVTKKLLDENNQEVTDDPATFNFRLSISSVDFKTSGFGAISGIPAGYTICVPGLPVGSVFKITEDPKTGYGLMGYERVMGSKIHEDGTVEPIPSYIVDAGNPVNIGTVIADENPQMEVHNRKGYGISAKKAWSDLSITTGHSESIRRYMWTERCLKAPLNRSNRPRPQPIISGQGCSLIQTAPNEPVWTAM